MAWRTSELTQASHPPHLTLAQTLYRTYINSTSINTGLSPTLTSPNTSSNPLPHLINSTSINTGLSPQQFTTPISTLQALTQASHPPHLTLAQTLYLTYINSTSINTGLSPTSPTPFTLQALTQASHPPSSHLILAQTLTSPRPFPCPTHDLTFSLSYS